MTSEQRQCIVYVYDVIHKFEPSMTCPLTRDIDTTILLAKNENIVVSIWRQI